MSTTSPFIQMVLQDLDENPDTWGSVLNVSALELLEDAVAGTATVTLISTVDYTMDDTVGGPTAADSARYMIISVEGSPGGATNIIVPNRSKLWLVANNTSDSSVITVKTSAGTGQSVSDGNAVWVYCDGTDIVGTIAASAETATTATTATNATQLGGVAAASYAQLAIQQTWTAGQVVSRTTLTESGGIVTPTINTSNSFYALWDGNYQLAAPTGSPVNGQTFSLVAQQGASGGPYTISYAASTFIIAGGSLPTLSTSASAIDYFGFEYCTNLVGGARWIISHLKGVS